MAAYRVSLHLKLGNLTIIMEKKLFLVCIKNSVVNSPVIYDILLVKGECGRIS